MNRTHSLFEFPEGAGRWRHFFPYALLLSVTFALYVPALYFEFVWDDVVYVQNNFRAHGLDLVHLRAIWTNTYLGHYAPLHHTLLALLYRFFQMDPFGYHLGQLLLHGACILLLYRLLKKLESARVALLATLLFAVHPTNIETVAWISETKSTLAFLFFLLSFGSFIRLRERGRWWDGLLCAFLLVCSLLAKINTVVAPAIFLLYDYRQGVLNRRKAWSLGALFLLSALFTAIHLAAFHGSEQTLESSYYGGLGAHLMNLPLLVLFYIQMTFFPYPLSAWHMFPVQTEWTAPLVLAWAGLLTLGWFLYRAPRTVQFWGLWFLIFLAPVLQIIAFPIWVADRYLYIPAIGAFVLGGRFFFQVVDWLAVRWKQRAWEVAMSAVVVVFAWQTQNYLPVWRNDLALWEATAKTCPTSPFCRCNLGLALLQKGEIERGVKELIRAVEIRPAPRYLVNLGDAYTLSLQDYRQAIIAYEMARQTGGPYLTADFYAKLARAYILAGELGKARDALRQGGQVNPRDPRLWTVNAFLHWKQGNYEEARRSVQAVVSLTRHGSNLGGLLFYYWGNAGQVGQLLADLRSAHSQATP
ncbi:MAG: glycosyltransferase family 39 protein [Acidobacteria bacterium]|nr:glycosyltransferase family 39 protein [Acidobacteriota bacterium]